MKSEEIIFDFDIDDNLLKTSQLETKIIDHQSLLFIIDDSNGNTYGGYVSSRIEKWNTWIEDQNSFIFSLLSGVNQQERREWQLLSFQSSQFK